VVARKTGLTVKLIRHWSDIGVVHPAHRTAAGYPLYGTEALARLQLAQTLRGLGLGLATIRDVLEREDTLPQVAATPVDALEAQIRTLRSQQAVLHSAARRNTTAKGLNTARSRLRHERGAVLAVVALAWRRLLRRSTRSRRPVVVTACHGFRCCLEGLQEGTVVSSAGGHEDPAHCRRPVEFEPSGACGEQRRDAVGGDGDAEAGRDEHDDGVPVRALLRDLDIDAGVPQRLGVHVERMSSC
jgi:DNA-binding transcriptional MerR regulator